MGSGFSSSLREQAQGAFEQLRAGAEHFRTSVQQVVDFVSYTFTAVWDIVHIMAFGDDGGGAEALRQAEAESAALDAELASSHARHAQLAQQVSNLDGEIQAVRAAIEGQQSGEDEELEAELAAVEADNARFAAAIQGNEAATARFLQETASAEAARDTFKSEVGKLKKTVKGLKNKLSNVFQSLPPTATPHEEPVACKIYGSGCGQLKVLSGPRASAGAPRGWGSKASNEGAAVDTGSGSSEQEEAAAF